MSTTRPNCKRVKWEALRTLTPERQVAYIRWLLRNVKCDGYILHTHDYVDWVLQPDVLNLLNTPYYH